MEKEFCQLSHSCDPVPVHTIHTIHCNILPYAIRILICRSKCIELYCTMSYCNIAIFWYIVLQLPSQADMWNNCGFLCTSISMELGTVIGHDPLSNFRSEATLDLVTSRCWLESICRDSADTQYMLIQNKFLKSPKQLTYKSL